MGLDMLWEVRTKEEEVVSRHQFARGAWHIHGWIERKMNEKPEQREYVFSKVDLQFLLIDLHHVQLHPTLADKLFPIPENTKVEEHYYIQSINELVNECALFLLRFDFQENTLLYIADW